MSSNTKYTVRIDGVLTDFTRSKKESAVAEAKRILQAKEGYLAEVVTQNDTVVFKAARRKVTVHTKPFTKVIEVSDAVRKAVPAGYTPAYTRPRNQTLVARANDLKNTPEDLRYVVINLLSAAVVRYVDTTRAAGAVQTSEGKTNKVAVTA